MFIKEFITIRIMDDFTPYEEYAKSDKKHAYRRDRRSSSRVRKPEFSGRSRERSSNYESRPSSGFGDDSGKRLEKFKAVCSKCGEECELPFRPSQNKPVFCSSCYRNVERLERQKSNDNYDGENNNSIQINEINRKLDKILRLLTGHKD